MKTGKITFIDSDGQWQNNYGTFNRYKVTMADGNVYKFNAKGEFIQRWVGLSLDGSDC